VQVRHIALKLGLPLVFAVACGLCAISSAAQTSNQSRHVVVVVWDGMRPDFVSEQNTPTLWKLAHEGVTFRNHHSVYPSATMVNGTAIVTGVYPGENGIIANHVYRQEIDPRHAIDVEIPSVVSKGDDLSGGKYISVPTIAEFIQRAGGRTVIAAAKTVGLLLGRHVPRGSSKPSESASPLAEGERMKVRGSGSVTLFAGKSLPGDALGPITDVLGPFPSGHVQQDAWTTKAVTDSLLKDGVPTLSILWLGEPDLTQHESAPGAPAALTAIKSSDENLAAVLSALDRQKARETTDLFVVSDHGFSTIERSIDLRKILSDAGFSAKTQFTDESKTGDIMLAGNGGSVLFYVIGHETAVTRRLVEFLQQSDFAGVIFTKTPMQGTFGLEQANIQNDHSPDVVMAFRWNDSKNQFSVPGMIDADWQRAAGKGTHATLSRFDMHNTLIAAGPGFRRGEADDLPTGNIDVTPTILQILGIKASVQMDGRILSEAMVNGDRAASELKPEVKTIEGSNDLPSGRWRQTLKVSRVGSTLYLDEGNGAFMPKR
jgi:arylsulfatase A-like enzyme